MKTYRLLPKAIEDLDEIWMYSAEHWSVQQADHYLDVLKIKLDRLAEAPKLGKRVDTIRRGYHRYQAERHVIFYRIPATGPIEIIRVLHEKMDFESHL